MDFDFSHTVDSGFGGKGGGTVVGLGSAGVSSSWNFTDDAL